MSRRCEHRHPAATSVALLALLAAVPLAGCGSGGSSAAVTDTVVVKTAGAPGASTQSTPAATSTLTSTATGATQSGTDASRPTTPAGAGTGHAAATPAPAGHVLREYSGAGDTRLGTIVVRSPSVLVWSAQRTPIQVFTATGFLLLNSSSPTGSTRLSRGTYRGVRVASHAHWSLQLRTAVP